MNRSEDSVMEGGSLWKAAWTSKFLEFFGKCGASRMLMAGLSIAKPSQISAIELDMFRRDSVCIAL